MSSPLVLAHAILEVGTQGIPDAQKQLGTLQGKLNILWHEYQQGTVGLDEYLRETAKLSSEMRNLQAAVTVAEQAIKKHGSAADAAVAVQKKLEASTTGMKSAFGGSAMTLMAFSNAFDDFQYGFHSVVNNIPQLATGLASIAGLSPQTSIMIGAFGQIGGVLISKAIPAVQKLAEEYGLVESAARKAMDGAVGEVEKLKLRIQELEEKPFRLAIDDWALRNAREQLKQYKEDLQAWEKYYKSLRSSHQQEAGKQAEDAIKETGEAPKIMDAIQKVIAKDLKASVEARLQADINKLENELAAAKKKGGMLTPLGVANTDNINKMFEIQAKIEEAKEKRRKEINEGGIADEEAKTKVGGVFEDAFKGDNPEARKKLVGYLRRIGREEVAKKVEETTPESVKTAADKKIAADNQHEQDQKDRDRVQRVRNDLAMEHMEKQSMEPMALKMLEMRNKGDKPQADINRFFQQQFYDEMQSRLTPEEKQSKRLDGLLQTEAIAFVKQLTSLAAQKDNQAKQATINDAKQAIDNFATVNRLAESAAESLKEKHAQGIPDLQALQQVRDSILGELTGYLQKIGIAGPTATKVAEEKASGLGLQAQRQVIAEDAADNRKDVAKDEKDEKALIEASIANKQLVQRVEQLMADAYAHGGVEDENHRFHPIAAEDVPQRAQDWVKDRLHHRYDNNNRPIINPQTKQKHDFNPQLNDKETEQIAKDVTDRAAYDMQMRSIGLSNTIQNQQGRLIRIASDLGTQIAAAEMRAAEQNASLSSLEHKVKSRQPGARPAQKRSR